MNTMLPRLSVAIIFRDEFRCIERCLRSLAPLREHLSCEIVMADTGSRDGSRAIAEHWADTVFDFPWIDDFAAARNAVLDRCRGDWILSVDCDEWLDTDTAELLRFLERDGDGYPCANLVVRNYLLEIGGEYVSSTGPRLLRRAAGPRFVGRIHEYPRFSEPVNAVPHLQQTVLHHDGYIGLNEKAGERKRARNLKLLRQDLRERPENLRALMEFIESGMHEPDYASHIRRGVDLTLAKSPRWMDYGPYLLRYAVRYAMDNSLPELEAWSARARELFPRHYATRLDVTYYLISAAEEAGDDAAVVREGRAWLSAYAAAKRDAQFFADIVNGQVLSNTPLNEAYVRCAMGRSLAQTGAEAEAMATLRGIDFSGIDGTVTHKLLLTLREQGALADAPDFPELMREFWAGICIPEPSPARAAERRNAFLERSFSIFSSSAKQGRLQQAAAMFLPLGEDCPAGETARVLAEDDPEKLKVLLKRQERLESLHPLAWAHALRCGVPFPLPEKPLDSERFDTLALGMADAGEDLAPLLRQALCREGADSWQDLDWTRALAAEALRRCDWTQDGPDPLETIRSFTAVEDRFLSRCFTADALAHPPALPSVHRFGLYAVRFFAQLDAGDYSACVETLRAAAGSCPERKEALRFLMRRVEAAEREQAQKNATPELLALAEQVRTILAGYPADDPAVRELKKTEVYRKVAYLIEE